jgi:transcriptional regulator with XRE-family HTH domain
VSVDERAEAKRLAKRLRETREYLDLSQQFVAEQTGIARSAISDIERGERRVESLELKRFAQVYGVTVSYFLEDDAAVDGAHELRVLARMIGGLNADQREEVRRFANYLRHSSRRPRRR